MELYDRQAGGLTLQTSRQLEQAGIPHGFTTRGGGVSEGIWDSLNLGLSRGDDPESVRRNYGLVCQALGMDRDRLVFSHQVHKDNVRIVTTADAGKGLDRTVDFEADGLITDIPGMPLVVFGADCPTVLLCDPVRWVAAAFHAGWRGTALGIADRVVSIMTHHYGSDPADILAAIGPCISACCFETDEDVPNAMTASLGAAALAFISGGEGGKFHVDLKGLNRLRLEQSGLLAGHVDVSPDCTMCRPDKYWSHRGTKGQRGSQAALIALP